VVVALFEVLVAVTTESTVFWDVMPYNPVAVQLFFFRNALPSSSGSKSKPSKQPARRREQTVLEVGVIRPSETLMNFC
jgi:hypothetical protein